MIIACPHCGHDLHEKLNDGLSNCDKCHQVFDSSDLNQLLSAGWLIRKHHYNLEQLKWHTKIEDDMAILVFAYVLDNDYSHQEFFTILTKLGVANKCYINYEK
jgi:hypothetical protein